MVCITIVSDPRVALVPFFCDRIMFIYRQNIDRNAKMVYNKYKTTLVCSSSQLYFTRLRPLSQEITRAAALVISWEPAAEPREINADWMNTLG